MRTLILSIAAASLAACSTPSSRNESAAGSGRDAAVAALMRDYTGRVPGASVLVPF